MDYYDLSDSMPEGVEAYVSENGLSMTVAKGRRGEYHVSFMQDGGEAKVVAADCWAALREHFPGREFCRALVDTQGESLAMYIEVI